MPHEIGETIELGGVTYICVGHFSRPFARWQFKCAACGASTETNAPEDIPIKALTLRCKSCVAINAKTPAMAARDAKPFRAKREKGEPRYTDVLRDVAAKAEMGLYPSISGGSRRFDVDEILPLWREETGAYPTRDYRSNARNQFGKIVAWLMETGEVTSSDPTIQIRFQQRT